jgi:8-oxo-dGTP diphosphatase
MAQNLSSGERRDRRRKRWTAENSAGYAAPAALAADVVVLTVRDRRLEVMTVERPDGRRALPGGFVGEREEPAATATRKLREKTGLADLYLEQLATFADPARDPRGWIPSVAYLVLVPPDTEPADPAARWDPVDEHDALAFDHEEILGAALDRVRGKLWWSNIAVGVLPGPFTMAQAREVYDAIAGTAYDPSTFARDLRATGLIEPAGHDRRPTGGRPAAVYAFTSHEPAWGAGRRKRVTAPSQTLRLD